MKLWVLHGKKVFTVVVIFLLMAVMAFSEIKLHDKLKLSTFTQSNIKELKKYSDTSTGIKYLLPKNWITERRSFTGGEILYHNEFKSQDSLINGYVQVWHSKKNLEEFLNQSKSISEKQNKILQYNRKPIETDAGKGYLVTYYIEVETNVFYRAEEYFIPVDNKFVRLSFFVDKKNYSESMSRIFKTIVDTVKF